MIQSGPKMDKKWSKNGQKMVQIWTKSIDGTKKLVCWLISWKNAILHRCKVNLIFFFPFPWSDEPLKVLSYVKPVNSKKGIQVEKKNSGQNHGIKLLHHYEKYLFLVQFILFNFDPKTKPKLSQNWDKNETKMRQKWDKSEIKLR